LRLVNRSIATTPNNGLAPVRQENIMNAVRSPKWPDAAVGRDGFDALDVCHRQMLFALGKLSALVARLGTLGPDAEARTMADELIAFFSTTVRQHHEDEERHVFPKLAAGDDPEVARAVVRLQTDHDWLEEDWMDLSPHLEAVAGGRAGYSLDLLSDGAAAFTALLHDHIALEESCIYPQARARLGAAEKHEMGREMAERRRRTRA
jgi:hemerythrin-like domain-containing protein